MALDREHREIERARGVDLVLAPRDWTAARVEAWLDWGEALACDYPAVDLPDALGPDSALDPVLGGGPDRYARRAAAWGLALRLFDAEGALSFREAILASLLSGEAAPARTLASGARIHPFAGAETPAAADNLVDLGDIEFAQAVARHLEQLGSQELAVRQ